MTGDHEQGDQRELERLLRGYETAILTTRGSDGHFHARPMAMQRRHVSTAELWFASALQTQKVADLEREPQCSVALSDGGHDATYVSLSGTAEVVRDRSTIRRLWEPAWRAWFPGGPEAQDLALIRFRPQHVEYVHPRTGRLQVLFTMVTNVLTGVRSEPAPKKQIELH